MILEIIKTFFYSLMIPICSFLKAIFYTLKELCPFLNIIKDITSAFEPLNILAYCLGMSSIALTLLLILIKKIKK